MRYIRSKIIALSLLSAVAAAGADVPCAAYDVFTQDKDTNGAIRVLILSEVTSCTVRIDGFYQVINASSGEVILKGKQLDDIITARDKGMSIGANATGCRHLVLEALDAETVIINNRKFRGRMNFHAGDGRAFSVVNAIALEDYIKGVLYHEVSHYWPQEVLKAQAIVCRSFAVYQRRHNRLKTFDVTNDIYSQVYGGKTSERYRTNKAVDDTAGTVLTYANRVLPAYFHATCAGHTEDASVLWSTDSAPLKGVLCPYCKDSPHFSWNAVLTVPEVIKKLAKTGCAVESISGIKVAGKDTSGRITDVLISDGGREVVFSAKDFRNAIGPNVIKSTNFTVELMNTDLVFVGVGWGHGVGLCQWGAYFMAKQGATYKEILSHYYPQALLGSVSHLADEQVGW